MAEREIYSVDLWSNWLGEFDAALDDFYDKYGCLPNLLEASEHTLSQFDYMATVVPAIRKKLDLNDLLPGEPVELAGLYFDDWLVHFCICDDIEDKQFCLVFADNLPDDFDDDDDDSGDNDLPVLPLTPEWMENEIIV